MKRKGCKKMSPIELWLLSDSDESDVHQPPMLLSNGVLEDTRLHRAENAQRENYGRTKRNPRYGKTTGMGVVSKHVTVQLLDIVLANRFGMPFYFKSTFSLIAITPLESLKICMNPKPRAIIAVQLGYYSFSVRRHGQVSFI